MMNNKAFEKTEKFQAKINEQVQKGYRVVNTAHTRVSLCALFEKVGQSMGKKKAFTLRIDKKILSALEKQETENDRSTNEQIEYLLNGALKRQSLNPKSSDASLSQKVLLDDLFFS